MSFSLGRAGKIVIAPDFNARGFHSQDTLKKTSGINKSILNWPTKVEQSHWFPQWYNNIYTKYNYSSEYVTPSVHKFDIRQINMHLGWVTENR